MRLAAIARANEIDAARLARLGRVDPTSMYPMQHRSTEVREDLLVLRAREVLWNRASSRSVQYAAW
jgi:hypothetical protein